MEVAPAAWPEARRDDHVRKLRVADALVELRRSMTSSSVSSSREPGRRGGSGDWPPRPGIERLPAHQVDRDRNVGAVREHLLGRNRDQRDAVDERAAARPAPAAGTSRPARSPRAGPPQGPLADGRRHAVVEVDAQHRQRDRGLVEAPTPGRFLEQSPQVVEPGGGVPASEIWKTSETTSGANVVRSTCSTRRPASRAR